ncbi:MAG: hypothetical protein GY820_10470 [Gammaproteobacteria bacterium]|nr:hypothetical protein [Gammaproteobacteria bacterium]
MTKGMHHPVETLATTASYSASSAAVFFGLTVDEWGIAAAIVGMIGAVATFVFNAWFKLKYHRH